MSKVLLIMGSVRQGRLCPQISEWVASFGKAKGLDVEKIDLKKWNLPLDDEPYIPALGKYEQEHTRQWSQAIKGAKGLVFVTPQYNWGYPAALKNAIDHLMNEWKNKPTMIVTYGGHGGTKACEQLKVVAQGTGMAVLPTTPALSLPRPVILGKELLDVSAFDAEPVEKAWDEMAAAFA